MHYSQQVRPTDSTWHDAGPLLQSSCVYMGWATSHTCKYGEGDGQALLKPALCLHCMCSTISIPSGRGWGTGHSGGLQVVSAAEQVPLDTGAISSMQTQCQQML